MVHDFHRAGELSVAELAHGNRGLEHEFREESAHYDAVPELPGYSAWCAWAEGVISSSDLDAAWARDMEAKDAANSRPKPPTSGAIAVPTLKIPAWIPNRHERRARNRYLAAGGHGHCAKWRYYLDRHAERAIARVRLAADVHGLDDNELLHVAGTEPLDSRIMPLVADELLRRLAAIPKPQRVRFAA